MIGTSQFDDQEEQVEIQFGLAERKDDNDWVKRCITWEDEEIRQRTPEKTWWDCVKNDMESLGLDLDLDNSRQEPEAITATSGCALQKSGEPTLEGRYCVGLSN